MQMNTVFFCPIIVYTLLLSGAFHETFNSRNSSQSLIKCTQDSQAALAHHQIAHRYFGEINEFNDHVVRLSNRSNAGYCYPEYEGISALFNALVKREFNYHFAGDLSPPSC